MSDWYYAVENEQKGPINESELKENLAAGKLSGEALVWKEGMPSWTPANQVPALSFRPPPAPARVQPTTVAATPLVNNPESTKPVDLAGMFTGKPEALEVDAADAEKNKIFGIVAYVPPLWLLPLLLVKDSPFAKYHANQGLVLFLFWIVVGVAVTFLDGIVNMAGLYFLDWFFGLIHLAPVVLVILGIINAAAGKCVPLPFIGGVKLIK